MAILTNRAKWVRKSKDDEGDAVACMVKEIADDLRRTTAAAIDDAEIQMKTLFKHIPYTAENLEMSYFLIQDGLEELLKDRLALGKEEKCARMSWQKWRGR